jgi:hypothetical protein
LAEVLQAGEREDSLTAAFGHDARETRKGGHVREFVEGEE